MVYLRTNATDVALMCGLRHELSSPAQTLRLRVGILIKVRMFVCLYSLCKGRDLTEADPPSQESYQPCIKTKTKLTGPTQPREYN
jgi:hypothetical protein